MTGPQGAALAAVGHPGAVVAGRTARRAARSGVLWGYVFGLTVASSALGYAAAYKTAGQRERVAALFAGNAGLAAINGPAHRIQTVAGYTVWKSFMFLMVLGAVWGLLTSTRLLRGEEDAGRWELLLAGQTTRGEAPPRPWAAGLGPGVLRAARGGHRRRRPDLEGAHRPRAGLFFALALVTPAAMFLAAGALAGQLASSRRQAAAYAARGLRRLPTPCGWWPTRAPAWRGCAGSPPGLGRRAPAPDRPPAAGPAPHRALTVLFGGLAVYLAGRRDLASGVWPARATAPARTRLWSGRPVWPPVWPAPPPPAGPSPSPPRPYWKASSPNKGKRVDDVGHRRTRCSRLGARGGSAQAYLGFAFLTLAIMVAFVAAGQVGGGPGPKRKTGAWTLCW